MDEKYDMDNINLIWMRNEPNIKMENGPENTCTFWVEETISSL